MAKEIIDHATHVEGVALELFKARSAALNGYAAKQIAIQSFRDAEVFIETCEGFRNGEFISRESEEWGDDAVARNLPDNHPVNMISRLKGDRLRVNRIAKLLEAKPEHPDIKDSWTLKDGDLFWDHPTTRIARKIFPPYATLPPAEKVAAASK